VIDDQVGISDRLVILAEDTVGPGGLHSLLVPPRTSGGASLIPPGFRGHFTTASVSPGVSDHLLLRSSVPKVMEHASWGTSRGTLNFQWTSATEA
jgi:hypothetical protein